jgi:hypothetical protein
MEKLKIKETKHFKNSAPFRSGQNSAADLTGRTYIFVRPLLRYATEESVSWEHCKFSAGVSDTASQQ